MQIDGLQVWATLLGQVRANSADRWSTGLSNSTGTGLSNQCRPMVYRSEQLHLDMTEQRVQTHGLHSTRTGLSNQCSPIIYSSEQSVQTDGLQVWAISTDPWSSCLGNKCRPIVYRSVQSVHTMVYRSGQQVQTHGLQVYAVSADSWSTGLCNYTWKGLSNHCRPMVYRSVPSVQTHGLQVWAISADTWATILRQVWATSADTWSTGLTNYTGTGLSNQCRPMVFRSEQLVQISGLQGWAINADP